MYAISTSVFNMFRFRYMDILFLDEELSYLVKV